MGACQAGGRGVTAVTEEEGDGFLMTSPERLDPSIRVTQSSLSRCGRTRGGETERSQGWGRGHHLQSRRHPFAPLLKTQSAGKFLCLAGAGGGEGASLPAVAGQPCDSRHAPSDVHAHRTPTRGACQSPALQLGCERGFFPMKLSHPSCSKCLWRL